MKWNGIVSQLSQRIIARRFATAKSAQPRSIALRRSKAVPRVADSLDRRVLAELLPQPPDADLDDVRAGIEVVAPDLGEETFAADHLAGVQGEVVQKPELAVGEVGDERPESRLPTREVEDQPSGMDDVRVHRIAVRVPQLHTDPCNELGEG